MQFFFFLFFKSFSDINSAPWHSITSFHSIFKSIPFYEGWDVLFLIIILMRLFLVSDMGLSERKVTGSKIVILGVTYFMNGPKDLALVLYDRFYNVN